MNLSRFAVIVTRQAAAPACYYLIVVSDQWRLHRGLVAGTIHVGVWWWHVNRFRMTGDLRVNRRLLDRLPARQSRHGQQLRPLNTGNLHRLIAVRWYPPVPPQRQLGVR